MYHSMRWHGTLVRAIDPFALFEQRIKDSLMKQLVKKVLLKSHIGKQGQLFK